MEDQKIVEALKLLGRVPSYRVAGFLGMNVFRAIKILDKLADDRKVIKHIETRATYYMLNEKIEIGKE